MPSLLEETLAEANRDAQTVTTDSRPIAGLPQGSIIRDTTTHIDDRGSLFEIYSTAWGVDEEPFEYVYCATIRPGVVKGWALHKEHSDRYCILSGEMRVVLYDVRADSTTCGKVFEVTLSEKRRRLLTIPPFVWHADYNFGQTEAMLVNMPTRQYDHANQDKYRLPIGTPLIPYSFGTAAGW